MSQYDVDKFDPPPDPNLVCCICQCVLHNPVESPCRHVFCKVCIETWLTNHHNCPACRRSTRKNSLKPVLPLVQSILNRLLMFCDFKDNGCEQKIMLEHYTNHIKTCGYEMVECRYPQCRLKLLRMHIENHEMNECGHREKLCDRQCGLMIPLSIFHTHDCLEELRNFAHERDDLVQKLKHKVDELSDMTDKLNKQIESLRKELSRRSRSPSTTSWSTLSSNSGNDTDVTDFTYSDQENADETVNNDDVSYEINQAVDLLLGHNNSVEGQSSTLQTRDVDTTAGTVETETAYEDIDLEDNDEVQILDVTNGDVLISENDSDDEDGDDNYESHHSDSDNTSSFSDHNSNIDVEGENSNDNHNDISHNASVVDLTDENSVPHFDHEGNLDIDAVSDTGNDSDVLSSTVHDNDEEHLTDACSVINDSSDEDSSHGSDSIGNDNDSDGNSSVASCTSSVSVVLSVNGGSKYGSETASFCSNNSVNATNEDDTSSEIVDDDEDDVIIRNFNGADSSSEDEALLEHISDRDSTHNDSAGHSDHSHSVSSSSHNDSAIHSDHSLSVSSSQTSSQSLTESSTSCYLGSSQSDKEDSEVSIDISSENAASASENREQIDISHATLSDSGKKSKKQRTRKRKSDSKQYNGGQSEVRDQPSSDGKLVKRVTQSDSGIGGCSPSTSSGISEANTIEDKNKSSGKKRKRQLIYTSESENNEDSSCNQSRSRKKACLRRSKRSDTDPAHSNSAATRSSTQENKTAKGTNLGAKRYDTRSSTQVESSDIGALSLLEDLIFSSSESDDTWEPNDASRTSDDTISEEIESDTNYELLIPKSTNDLLNEYASSDTDDSWVP